MKETARLVFAALAALALVACGGGGDSAAPHQGRGIIRGIQRDIPRVAIEHGDIPGLMTAMTMGFELADKSMVEGLKLGQEVEFTVVYENAKYRITAIKVLAEPKPEAPPAEPGQPAPPAPAPPDDEAPKEG
jgi:Cu(I)/Ag(I) efflux system membrane protein CusA/SilA